MAPKPKVRKIAKKNGRGQSEVAGELQPQIADTASRDGGRLGANHCKSLKDMLPPEILDIIFKNLESPKDLLSCWNTTSTWAAALKTTDSYFKMALPFLMRYLNQRDLLRCSSVSKPWNAAVDTCVQYMEDFGSDNRLKPNQRIILKLHSYNMTHFLNQFTSSTNIELGQKIVPANPVLFRRVKINLSFPTIEGACDSECEDWIKWHKCLDHFGYLIRHLELQLTGESVHYMDKIELLKSCLESTPNLRVLVIEAPSWGFCEQLDEEYQNAKQNAEELKTFNSSPWPELEQLKVLKFHDKTVRKGFAIVANAYAPQLLYLKFGYHHTGLMGHPNSYSRLQKIVYLFKEYSNGKDFGEFVQSNKCPLKHLTMVCVNPDTSDLSVRVARLPELEPEKIPNGLMFAVNCSGNFLQTLILRPIKKSLCFNIAEYDFKQLHLPKLKVLKLESFGYVTFEFLVHVCPKLEELIMTMTPALYDYRIGLKPTFFYNLYSKRQFWKRMAAIELVDIEYRVDGREVLKVYTRRRYKEILENGESTIDDNEGLIPTQIPQWPFTSISNYSLQLMCPLRM